MREITRFKHSVRSIGGKIGVLERTIVSAGQCKRFWIEANDGMSN